MRLQLARDGSAAQDMAAAGDAAAAAPPLVHPDLLDSPSAVQGPLQQAASPHIPGSSTAPACDVSTFPAGATFDNKLFQPSPTAQPASLVAAGALQDLQPQDTTQASTVQLLEQLQVRVQQALAAAGSISTLPSQVPEMQAPAAAVPADEWEGVTLMTPKQLQQAGVAMQGASPALLPEPRAAAPDEWAGVQLMSETQLQSATAADGWYGAQLMSDTQLREAGIHVREDTAGLRARQPSPAALTPDSAGLVPMQALPRRMSAQPALQDQPPQEAPFFTRQESAKRSDDHAQAQSPSQMLQQAQTLALQAQQLHLSSQAAVHRLRKANHARPDRSVPAPQLPQTPVPLASPAFMPVRKAAMASKPQQQQSRQIAADATDEPCTSSAEGSAVQRPSQPLWAAKPAVPEPAGTAETPVTAQDRRGADVQMEHSLQALSAEPAPDAPGPLASELSGCAPLPVPQQQQQQQQGTAETGADDAPETCGPAATLQHSALPEPSTRHVWSEAEARLAAAPPASSFPGPSSTDHRTEEPESMSGPLLGAKVVGVAPASQGLGQQPEGGLAGNAAALQVRQGGPATLPLLVSGPGCALE